MSNTKIKTLSFYKAQKIEKKESSQSEIRR